MNSDLTKTRQLSRLLQLRDNTLALWRFRNSLSDSSGNDNDLTAVAIGSYISGGLTENVVTAIAPTGPAGPAAKIIAASATDFDFGTGDFTIEGIMFTSESDALLLVDKYDSGSPILGFYFGVGIGYVAAKIGDGANDILGGSAGAVNDGRWHHVALVIDRTNDVMRFYIDGVEDSGSPSDISSVTGSISAASNDLQIGKLFDGGIDEICIHPAALPASEIASRAAGLLSPIVPVIPNELKQYFRGIDDSPEFDEFLIPFKYPFAALRQKARDITDLVKFDQVQERHLGALASLFNFELPDSSLLHLTGRRTMFKWITWLYEHKGTHACVEKWLDLIGLTATTVDGYPDTSIFIMNVSRLVGYPLIPLTLFTEDFEDNLSQWDPPLNPNLPWRIQNGALYCKVGSDTNYDNAILFDDSARTFYIEADIKLIDAVDELFGFYLTYQDSDNWLRLSKEPHHASSTKWVLRWSDRGTTGSAVISDDWGDDWDAYNNGDTIKLWLHVDLDRKLYTGGVGDQTFMFEGTDSHPDIVGTKKGLWLGLNAELEWDNVTVKNMRSELEATLSGQSDRTLKLFYPGTSEDSQRKKAFLAAVLPRYVPFGVILEWVREIPTATRIGFRTAGITAKSGWVLNTDRAARMGFRTAGVTAIRGDVLRIPSASRLGFRTRFDGVTKDPSPASRIGFRTGSISTDIVQLPLGGWYLAVSAMGDGIKDILTNPTFALPLLVDEDEHGSGQAADNTSRTPAYAVCGSSQVSYNTITIYDNYSGQSNGLFGASHNKVEVFDAPDIETFTFVEQITSLTRTARVTTVTLGSTRTSKQSVMVFMYDGCLRAPNGTILPISEITFSEV